MVDREQLCRILLERVAAVDRLRAIRDELRALEYPSLGWGIMPAIRQEHWRISECAHRLGLSPLTSTRDAAAFARAQLGLPIDAPSAIRIPRAAPTWQRELAIMTGVTAA